MILIVAGVSGSGKTTVGALLAGRLAVRHGHFFGPDGGGYHRGNPGR